MRLTRRAFLAGAGATVVAACSGSGGERDGAGAGAASSTAPSSTTTSLAPPAVDIAADPFGLGVASGDPRPDAVVLWTRLLGTPAEATQVLVEVAAEPSFAAPAFAALAEVDVERGFAVHADATGLEPATTYSYRFRVGEWTSPVGTTRTAPAADSTDPVRLAVAACQRYDHGFYAAHRSIADAGLDLVVFVGDFIYESPTTSEPARPLPDGPYAGVAVADLDGYRARYEAALTDADLTAARAAHPWAVTWDDHEVRNNYAGGDPATDEAQRAAAYQAWWEHQPVRLPPPPTAGAGPYDIDRSLGFGAILDLVMLDTRQHRTVEACGGGLVASSCAELTSTDRTMLGPDEEARVGADIGASRATWTALANSVVLAPIQALDMVNADAWDGYPAARSRLLGRLAGVGNAVVLTGDIHVQLVADVPGDDGAVVATELVTPSISSRSDSRIGPLVPLLPTVAPDVKFGKDSRGWLRCDVTADTWTATFFDVADASSPTSAVTEGAVFVVTAGTPGAVQQA